MKQAIHLLLITVFLIISLFGNAEEKLQLKLHEGQRIRFSYSHHSTKKEHGLFFTETEGYQWETELLIKRKTDENRLMIEVKPMRYIYNKRTGSQAPDIHFDSRFPPSSREGEFLKMPYLSADILCSMTIKMQLDLQTNKLKFQDVENLNAEIDRIIEARMIKPEDIKNTKKGILDNIKEIDQFTHEYLLHFHHATFNQKDSTAVTQKDYVISRSEQMIRLNRKETTMKEGRTGEETQEVKINAGTGLIEEYVSTIYLPGYARKYNQYVPPKSEKKTYRLISNSEVRPGETVVSGYIEHPVGRRVHIQFLDDPAGLELKTVTTALDNANRFSVSIPLKRESFLFVSNAYNENWDWNQQTRIIYAEPGDQISFELTGTSPRTMVQKGDRIAENSFLSSNMSVLTIQGAVYVGNKKTTLLYGVSLPFLLKSIPGNIQTIKDCDDFIMDDQLNKQLNASDLSFRFKTYFSNEMAMAKLNLACSIQVSMSMFREQNEPDSEMKDTWINLKMFTDTFQVNHYYNEYGYFSRKAASDYAGFLYLMAQKIRTSEVVRSSPIRYGPFYTLEKNHFYNFLDLVLAGSALIREKARVFSEMLNNPSSSSLETETRFSLYEEFYHELMRCSDDSLLNAYLTKKFNHAREFSNGSVFSRKILLNEQGDSVSIRDFIGNNPVVISMTTDWATSRINFDQMAEKHPEATFIFLVSGSHFEAWKDYLSRANAKAIQLFLPSGNYSLKELFGVAGRQTRFLVFDVRGSMIGQTNDEKQAEILLQQAKNPLSIKKEPDKAVLMGIIWILGGLILLFVTAFLIFKYRVRRKMKKQEQEKRLRELELTAIRSQMNPHFLFNSLNSVQNLIRQNQAAEAHLYLSDFAGIIRKVMRNSEKEEISLAEELDLVDQYLRVERLRFDFEYTIQVEDQVDAPHLMIPPLLIQPFAENALIHGLQYKPSDRRLQIDICKEGAQIRIVIEDNGIGREAAAKQEPPLNGKGIKMNTERLKILEEKYGGTYSIRIIDLLDEGKTGTRVEIILPDEE
ncbi:MAG: sensor histidine kinase [Mangrovibacterium sp.]